VKAILGVAIAPSGTTRGTVLVTAVPESERDGNTARELALVYESAATKLAPMKSPRTATRR
jgi:hypothetical protein